MLLVKKMIYKNNKMLVYERNNGGLISAKEIERDHDMIVIGESILFIGENFPHLDMRWRRGLYTNYFRIR